MSLDDMKKDFFPWGPPLLFWDWIGWAVGGMSTSYQEQYTSKNKTESVRKNYLFHFKSYWQWF